MARTSSDRVIPDLNWYLSISSERGGTPRCPFASVERCPRYFESLALLGQAGSTRIEPVEERRLLEKWKQSDLWPRTAEYEPSISGWEGNSSHFDNFCPEIAFDRFGYFAVSLNRYADEIDSGTAHERLAKEGAPAGDPQWNWASVRPSHYTECPLYSPLLGGTGRPAKSDGTEHEISLSLWGAAIRLKNPVALVRAGWAWISNRWRKRSRSVSQ
jgi:hypothetical protein